jgi:hypothetical protein
MTMLDQTDSGNKSGTNVEVMPMEQGREEARQFLEALQAAETLLQDPTSAVFPKRLSFQRFKELEALVESFPFRSEVPLGFRFWWESSEPKRREWLEEVKKKRTMSRRAYFTLANLPLKQPASDTYVGSVFWVLALKDEKGRIRFVKAASGFLAFGAMENTFRHSPDSLADPEPKSGA